MRTKVTFIEEPHVRGTRVTQIPEPATRTQVQFLGSEASKPAQHPGLGRPDGLNTRVRFVRPEDAVVKPLVEAVAIPSDPRERILLAIETEERAADELDKQAERVARSHGEQAQAADTRISAAHDALRAFDEAARRDVSEQAARDAELDRLKDVASSVKSDADLERMALDAVAKATSEGKLDGDTQAPPEERDGDG